MICFPPLTFRLPRKYYCNGVPFNLVIAFVYSADVDLHICSISSDVVNTAATGAIATLDSIYDTSNMDIGPSLRSITLDSGTIVSLRNRSYSHLPHPRGFADLPGGFSHQVVSFATAGAQREIFAANYSSASKPRKYRCSLVRPLQSDCNSNVVQGFAL